MTVKHTYILLSVVSLLLTSCIFSTKKAKKVVAEKTIDNYTDTYTITPKTDLPKFKELTVAFEKQAHRFEIEKCQFKYNGQSFFMGDSPEKIIQIFGEPEEKIKSIDGKVLTYKYDKLKFKVRFSLATKKMIYYLLYMSDYKGHKDTPYDVIKFRQIPYQLDMKLNDFMALSDLTHDKLRRTRFYFFMLQKECPPSKAERIYTYLESQPSYTVEGGGHLTFTGDFNPNKSAVIEGVEVSVQTLSSLKGLKSKKQ